MTAEVHYLSSRHVQCVRFKEKRVSRELIALPRITVLAWWSRLSPREGGRSRSSFYHHPSSHLHSCNDVTARYDRRYRVIRRCVVATYTNWFDRYVFRSNHRDTLRAPTRTKKWKRARPVEKNRAQPVATKCSSHCVSAWSFLRQFSREYRHPRSSFTVLCKRTSASRSVFAHFFFSHGRADEAKRRVNSRLVLSSRVITYSTRRFPEGCLFGLLVSSATSATPPGRYRRSALTSRRTTGSPPSLPFLPF